MIVKITQKRIARAQRQERQCAAVARIAGAQRKNAIDDFVGSAVPTYREKISIATLLRLAYQFRSVPCGVRFGGFDLNSVRAQLLERRRRGLSAASASRSWIHNGEKTRLHSGPSDGNYRRPAHCCAHLFG